MNNCSLGCFLNEITQQGRIDLHTHTTASDGSYTPQELYQLAKHNGLTFLAITDHDTILGISRLLKTTQTLKSYMTKHQLSYEQSLERAKTGAITPAPLLIAGAELSVVFEQETIHLLAYFAGEDILRLTEFFEQQRQNRYRRNANMLKKLQSINIPIPDQELDPTHDEPSPGRVKVAKWLIQNNYVHTVSEAFANYLSKGKPAYVEREKVTLKEALEVILNAGGFPVIAHPHQYGWCQNSAFLKQKIASLPAQHSFGLEVFHSDATISEIQMLLKVAEELKLMITAGSDFHGINKEDHALYSSQLNPANFYRETALV